MKQQVKRAIRFAVIKLGSARIQRLPLPSAKCGEKLEISQQVSGASAKKVSTVFSDVHELFCNRKSDVNCK